MTLAPRRGPLHLSAGGLWIANLPLPCTEPRQDIDLTPAIFVPAGKLNKLGALDPLIMLQRFVLPQVLLVRLVMGSCTRSRSSDSPREAALPRPHTQNFEAAA